MTKANLYTSKGTKTGTIALPKVFSEKENMALLAQAIRVYTHTGHSDGVKKQTRADVNRTKKKVYRQKGTGGARHGAKSAPIFVGGGVAHGPTGLRRPLTLPRKMAQKALGVAFSMKAKREEVVVLSGLDKVSKTKEASQMLAKVAGGRALIALSEKNKAKVSVFKNIKNADVMMYKDLNAHKVILGGVLVIDNEVFEVKKTKK